MRYWSVPAVLAALTSLAPAAHADDWSDYSRLMGRYYTLDPHAFKQLTCQIDSTLLDHEVKLQMMGFPEGNVTASRGPYSVSVSNTGDIDIQGSVLTLSANDPRDQAALPSLNDALQAGYKQYLEISDLNIKDVLGNYLPPDEADTLIESIDTQDSVTVIEGRSKEAGSRWKLTVTGADAVALVSNDIKQGDETLPASGTLKFHYRLVDGKYLLESKVDDAVEGKLHRIVTMTVDYQSLAGLTFPKTVRWTHAADATGGAEEESVSFHDCKVTK